MAYNHPFKGISIMLHNKIAIVATGDELVSGDILNTNGQVIAQTLHDRRLPVGKQVIVGDDEIEISRTLQFLLEDHSSVVIIGGLGPTTDDRTRFAVSTVINQPLAMIEACWQHVVERLQRFNVTIHDNNRQQALFPESARIIFNPHGTACGCAIDWQDNHIFLLPGPPQECLPLFNQSVLPELLTFHTSEPWVLHHWRLFGIGESIIAQALEDAVKGFSCHTGYRLDYPYLEFKLHVPQGEDQSQLLTQVQTIVAKYLLSDPYERASDVVKQLLEEFAGKICIDDQATGGRLQSSLLTPKTRHALHFGEAVINSATLAVKIEGLHVFWNNETSVNADTITLTMTTEKGITETFTYQLPYRNHPRVIDFAVEHIAHQLVVFLRKA